MSQKPADERSDLILVRVNRDQAVACMAESAPVEARVASEERRVPQGLKLNQNVLVLQTFCQDIVPDLTDRNPPRFEQLPLAVENILIENNQARTRSRTYSVAAYSPA